MTPEEWVYPRIAMMCQVLCATITDAFVCAACTKPVGSAVQNAAGVIREVAFAATFVNRVNIIRPVVKLHFCHIWAVYREATNLY